MTRRIKYTDDTIRRMREDWATGDWNIGELGQKYGVSSPHVSDYLTARKRPDAPGPIVESTKRRPGIEQKVAEMHGRFTNKEICKELRISNAALIRIKNGLGLSHANKARAGVYQSAKMTEADVRKMRILYSMIGNMSEVARVMGMEMNSRVRSAIRRESYRQIL